MSLLSPSVITNAMGLLEALPLCGARVRLEPLNEHHVEALALASSGADADLYRWSFVPVGVDAVRAYVAAALQSRENGSALSFATVRLSDETVVGSTRFFNIEYWRRPQGHPLHSRTAPDGCEIGYTWLNQSAIRTAIKTEAKYMMLRHACERWNVERVCLHTDARNERSRAAMERIGATFEGILRSHRMAVDFGARDSARYSIVAPEWPGVRERLLKRLTEGV